ncbi:hypothetical protein OBK27_13410 [Empedobacter falsenii]
MAVFEIVLEGREGTPLGGVNLLVIIDLVFLKKLNVCFLYIHFSFFSYI